MAKKTYTWKELLDWGHSNGYTRIDITVGNYMEIVGRMNGKKPELDDIVPPRYIKGFDLP